MILKEKGLLETRDQVLQALNKRGLIPGPEECEETFFARCVRSASNASSAQLWDMKLDWVKILYQSKGLHFWEGGCTWIEGDQTLIQLHPSFFKKRRHWGYCQEEIISHELVHVIRGAFEEPIFEEILAYHTSPSPFRRYWGPLWRTTHETTAFLIILFLCTIASFFEPLGWCAWGCSALLLGYFSVRLIRNQRIFKRALQRIKGHVGIEKSLPLMLHLTDQEIIHFSKIGHNEVVPYSLEMAQNQIRWQQIRASYF